MTFATIEALIERVLGFASIDELRLPGLSERRAQVWPGGLAILVELISVLRIRALQVSDGGLREGLLYDLLGRMQHEDARERTVRAMSARYQVDESQASRVADTAGRLLAQCADDWGLGSPLAANMLDWGARLHEIGLDISHDGFQRHGAYVAEHADMPGFPRTEQRLLAFLIGSQRREIDSDFNSALPGSWRAAALRLVLLLRLAVLLNRSRRNAEIAHIGLAVNDSTMQLDFDADWLAANPLTVADLDREQSYLGSVGYKLEYG